MKTRQGFSLVEVLIATMILTVGLLAMAASTGYVAAALRSSSFDTQRTQAKQRIVEQLRGTTYANVNTNATATAVGRYNMTWTVTQNSNQLTKRVQLVTSGPAYRTGRGSRTTIVDTMYFDILVP